MGILFGSVRWTGERLKVFFFIRGCTLSCSHMMRDSLGCTFQFENYVQLLFMQLTKKLNRGLENAIKCTLIHTLCMYMLAVLLVNSMQEKR